MLSHKLPTQGKPVIDSRVENNEIVQPGDLNINNTLFGGRLVALVDKIAAISAFKHSDMSCVTISIDHLIFKKPVPQGSLITLRACVNRVFNTSLEVGVKVTMRHGSWAKGEEHVCSAYLTFVTFDENGKKSKSIQALPQSADEIRRFKHASMRREGRKKLKVFMDEMQANDSEP